jgi:hypothetical protein
VAEPDTADRVWQSSLGGPALRAIGGVMVVVGCAGLSLLWLDPDATLVSGRQLRWSWIGGAPFLILVGGLMLLGRETYRVDRMTRSAYRLVGVGPLVHKRVVALDQFARVEIHKKVIRTQQGARPLFWVELRGRARLPLMRAGGAERARLTAERVSRVAGLPVVDRTEERAS